MGIALATMRTNVLTQLGIDQSDLAGGQTDLDLLLNKSWWEIMDKIDFREKEDSTTIQTVVGTEVYDLAATLNTTDSVVFDALRGVAIEDNDDNSWLNLNEVSQAYYDNNLISQTSAQDKPQYYMREGGNITFLPTPDDVYNIKLRYLKILSDIPTDGPVVHQTYHEIIELGAIWRGHLLFRDFNSAREVKSFQLSLLQSSLSNASKEDRNTKYAGVEVVGTVTGRRY